MLNSVVLKNIKSLRSSLKENISYTDVNYNGIDDNDSVTVSDEKCVLDRFKIWIQSGTYDYHRKPDSGGFLEKYVVKEPFNDASCGRIEAMLKAEAFARFPEIELLDVQVKCNYSLRKWEIRVAVRDKKTGLVDDSMLGPEGKTILFGA